MAQPMRVLIADDNVHTQDGLRALLVSWAEVEVVGKATNGQEVVYPVDESPAGCRVNRPLDTGDRWLTGYPAHQKQVARG